MVLVCEQLIRYPLVLITVYNAVDLTSRYIPLVKCLKMESRKGLMLAILLRMLLVPAFYFTARYGDLGWMMMLTSLLGFSNGYFTVCVMIVAPKGYQVSSQFERVICNSRNFFLLVYSDKQKKNHFIGFRDLSRMPWVICLFCGFSSAYLQGFPSTGYG